MQDQETVTPEENVDLANEAQPDQPQEAQEVDTQVPLHALQKERRKRQEFEQKVKFYEEKEQKAADDSSQYESATREDLGKQQEETIRIIEERKWARDNPEMYQKITDDLPAFLKLRPNFAGAIDQSSNRYEEAWALMQAFSPKQKQQIVEQSKPPAPGSPSGVPKAASLNESVDLMNMSDAEFNTWRKEKRKRR